MCPLKLGAFCNSVENHDLHGINRRPNVCIKARANGRCWPLLSLAITLWAILAASAAWAQMAPFHAGVTRISVSGEDRFDTFVWYPTDAEEIPWQGGPFSIPTAAIESVCSVPVSCFVERLDLPLSAMSCRSLPPSRGHSNGGYVQTADLRGQMVLVSRHA